MVTFTFFVFDGKNPFWAYLAICNLDWIKYAEFIGSIHFFYFRMKISFSEKFGPKKKSCQFKMEFST